MSPRGHVQGAGSDYSWRPMLAARLVRNEAVHAGWDARHARFEVSVPCRKPRYLVPPISWVVRPPEMRTMVLDHIGVSVWEACNGARTVEDVIDEFAGRHGLTFHESRVAVVSFIKTLLERGALALVVTDQAERESEPGSMGSVGQSKAAGRKGSSS